MAVLNLPFPRGVIERVPEAERDALGVFPSIRSPNHGLRSVSPAAKKSVFLRDSVDFLVDQNCYSVDSKKSASIRLTS